MYKTCLQPQQHIKGLNGLLSLNGIWKYDAPRYPTIDYISQLCCPPSDKVALVQIMRTLDTAPPIVFYDNCKANLYAALRRQWTATPAPCESFLDKLEGFMVDTIMPEIELILRDFHYSYDVWYNHLTKQQQDSMDSLDKGALHVRYVNIFCKSEKQLVEGGEMPKNRAISAMCEEHKYVMGPVIYALEQYFKQLKGYGGGKNWQQTAEMVNDWKRAGFTKVVQSDISGMDRSITQRIKEIIGHRIYKLVEPFVTHVPIEIWQIHAYATRTKITANYYVDKLAFSYGSSDMEGEVFSGSSDTTYLNTTITAIVQRYVYERVLGLQPEEYGITAKGDDSVNAIPPSISNESIRNAFAMCYYQAKDIKGDYVTYLPHHGSGLVLKFLSISEHLDDIDYCSTNCYECEDCGFRFTRKIDRFIYLTPWSETIKNLSHELQLSYKQNLYEANLSWMRNLPIFHELNEELRTNVKTHYSLVGSPRKTLPLNQRDATWYAKYFDEAYESRRALLQQQFGKSAAYSLLDQISEPRPCCVKAYRLWLFNKLGLTDSDIATIQYDISSASGTQYQSATLTHAIHMFDEYKNSLLD